MHIYIYIYICSVYITPTYPECASRNTFQVCMCVHLLPQSARVCVYYLCRAHRLHSGVAVFTRGILMPMPPPMLRLCSGSTAGMPAAVAQLHMISACARVCTLHAHAGQLGILHAPLIDAHAYANYQRYTYRTENACGFEINSENTSQFYETTRLQVHINTRRSAENAIRTGN